MSQNQQTKQAKEPSRAQVLGALVSQVQGQGFNVQQLTSQLDGVRDKFREQSGWEPAFFINRILGRQAERIQSLSKPRVALTQDPQPEEKPSPPPISKPPAPVFTCPWRNEGCTFETDSPDALKTHVTIHTRSQIRTY